MTTKLRVGDRVIVVDPKSDLPLNAIGVIVNIVDVDMIEVHLDSKTHPNDARYYAHRFQMIGKRDRRTDGWKAYVLQEQGVNHV